MATSATAQIIRCPNCGANNRVVPSENIPVCGRCKTPLPTGAKPVTVTDANFSEIVDPSPVPVLLDMWAPWCGPCRMIAPIIDQLATELAGKVTVGKLNVDENPMTASRFNVQSIPTMLILQNGREAERIVGLQSKETIVRQLQRLL